MGLKLIGDKYSLVKLQSGKNEDRITVVYALLLHDICRSFDELKELRENIIFKVDNLKEVQFLPRLKRDAKFMRINVICTGEESVSAALRTTLMVLAKHQFGIMQCYY